MNIVSLTVNGRSMTSEVEPRLHLADFLRETLHLTGTHLGCEHGVCGACTLLLNGAPARACITFAAACEGSDVVSIEGLQDDEVMAALRTAFSAEHALQCGYCTPGMLVTARDIVRRLPHADDDRVRLELSGNLCRCTGYNGIVKAIRRVLDLRMNIETPPPRQLPSIDVPSLAPAAAPVPQHRAPSGSMISQHLRIGVPAETLWAALQDPSLVASCIPGAAVTSVEGAHITGEMAVSLGPIRGRFTGGADLRYGDMEGTVTGEGQDQISKTRLSASANFIVSSEGADAVLRLDISYNLRGPLAQFARGAVVQAFAAEIAGIVGQNLQARLSGDDKVATPRRLGGAALFLKVLWRQAKHLLTGGARDD